MKKSTFLAVAAVVLAFFIVSAFGKRKGLYEKKENFERPEEAIVNFIGYINSFEMVRDDNGYYSLPTREFLESISKRYRLYIGEGYGHRYISEQVPVLYSYEMKEVDYNSLTNLKNNYEYSYNSISNYKRDNNPRVYRLEGYGGYNNNFDKSYVNEDGTVKNIYNDQESPLTIYLVVVDEGEGFVVDYYSVVYQ